MAIRVRSKKNLLDFIPVKSNSTKFESTINKSNNIRIIIHRNSILDRFIRKFIKKTPLTFNVDLDDYGSFIYNSIDGTKTIYEIGNEVKEHFGDEVEPLYERLGAFCNLLKNNDFIYFKK